MSRARKAIYAGQHQVSSTSSSDLARAAKAYAYEQVRKAITPNPFQPLHLHTSFEDKLPVDIAMSRKRQRTNGDFNGGYQAGVAAARGRAMMSYLPETKYFDCSTEQKAIATANDWSGTEVLMTNRINGDGATITAYTAASIIPSAQGTGYGEILGVRYKLKGIRIKGHCNGVVGSDSADMIPGAVVRIVLVMDTNANAAQAQGENVFTDFGSDTVNVHSFLNMGTTTGKFRILRDMRVVLNPADSINDATGASGTASGSRVLETQLFHMQWKPKTPITVTLAASAATPATAQLQSHNIFVLALTNDTSGALIHFCTRAYFCE